MSFSGTTCSSCTLCESDSALQLLGLAQPDFSLDCSNIDSDFEPLTCVNPESATIVNKILLLDANVTRTPPPPPGYYNGTGYRYRSSAAHLTTGAVAVMASLLAAIY